MEQLNIIKVGGNVIDDTASLLEFLERFQQLSGKKILVHGGGKIATKIAAALDIETKMVEGRRVTDEPMLEVVTMAYGGLINKQIVSKLQGMGVQAMGLTGADANLILASKRPVVDGVDYGFVGDPKAVNASFIQNLLENDILPVLAPLTHDGNGNMLNTNADTIAQIVGSALSETYEVYLNFCFELPGVMADINDPDSLLSEITRADFVVHKENGVINAGMIPKLENAFQAITEGVKAVRILHHSQVENLGKQGNYVGTTIR